MSETQNLDRLLDYTWLQDPAMPVIIRGLVLMIVGSLIYCIFGLWIPDHPQTFYPLLRFVEPEEERYLAWISNYLMVPPGTRWDRLMLLSYLSLYVGMWWAYFASKKYPGNDERESRSLKIQSLRRLLGMTSHQWQPHVESTSDDDEAINTFRRKSDASMQVIAILIAVSILIFDQISNIWMTDKQFTVWQYAILWFGMLSAMVSFICFMMCVDALDTIYNRFNNDPVRNVLVKYFYGFTINPRYAGGAAMLLSISLLLGFHSELLGSLAIIVTLMVGYNLWFPNIQDQLNAATGTCVRSNRKGRNWYGTLLLLPIAIRALVFFVHA